jgi:hypothetical protein
MEEVLFSMQVEVVDDRGRVTVYRCVNGRCRKLGDYYSN